MLKDKQFLKNIIEIKEEDFLFNNIKMGELA